MFFQFSPPKAANKKPKQEPIPEIAVLSLAPFAPLPKILFENVKVGHVAIEKLVLKNSTPYPAKILANLKVDEDVCITLSWNQKTLQENSDDTLEICWTPKCEGSWRFILEIEANSRSRNVPLVLKAVGNNRKKSKGLPRFPAKKVTSPVPAKRRKSPLKKIPVPNIQIKICPPENQYNGKENIYNGPFTPIVTPTTRRDTYIVPPEAFEDSLEKNESFERMIKSEFKFAATPEICFQPELCSTDEKSVSAGRIFSGTGRKLNLSNATFDVDRSLGNVSGATYVKEANETYTKDESINSSKQTRLESLLGSGIRQVIESDHWAKPKLSPIHNLRSIKEFSPIRSNLSCIRECSFESFRCSTKRKLESVSVISPKRANLSDWAKDRTALTIDPETAKWLQAHEGNFVKWLNAVLAPPDLDSDVQHPLDVAKLWRSVQKNQTVEPQPVHVSSNRFNALRKNAQALYKSKDVQEVLAKVWTHIDLGKLSVRSDRDIHLDLTLQADVMSVILSYNTLWLRLGLETIYNRQIDLESNSDIVGLTNFLWQRFIRNPFLLKRHKSQYAAPYVIAIKRFILKKFLALVYFLDVAKTRKLIPHDPCLFCKNAPIKSSRDALLTFSREILSSMGDITKYLRHLKYTVQHSQTYLDEFDFKISKLHLDLRDGVRLTRLLEILLLKPDLCRNLRVPAVSRLQKVHNVKLVFSALENAGFEVMYDITHKNIVDGFKEKTLSFVWQLIYKFQTPLMAKSVTLITNWWRSEKIVIKREELRILRRRRNEAAAKIQRWYKRKMYEKYQAEKFQLAATLIQRKWRAHLAMQRDKIKYHVIKQAVITIQRSFRAHKLQKSAIFVQRKWRATLSMRTQRKHFEKLKAATLFVQRSFRAKQTLKKYGELKKATIFIQQKWRATLAMREELLKYQVLKSSTLTIQQHLRAYIAMKQTREDFEKLKKSTIFVQRTWRAKVTAESYKRLKNATLTIQRRFKANKLAREQHEHYQKLKRVTSFLQSKWRAELAMKRQRKQYEELRNATLNIQRRFRAKLVAQRYQNLKKKCVIVQQQWRAKLAMRSQRKEYEDMKKATVITQRRFRANLAAKQQRNSYLELKKSAIFIQRKWRATLAARIQRKQYEELKRTVLVVQRRYRANLAAKLQSNNYKKLKIATVFIQRKFRATLAKNLQRKKYQNLKTAVLLIQRRYRANVAAKRQLDNYQKFKKSVVFIQQKWRAKTAMKLQLEQYQSLKTAALVIQRRYRANRLAKFQLKTYQQLKRICIFVQQKWRATLAMRLEVNKYREIKNATLVIQRRFRANLAAKKELTNYQKLKKTSVFIQRRFRANSAMKSQRNSYQKLKNAATIVQRRLRANLRAKLELNNYRKLKTTTILIQQKWRAKIAMKVQEKNYQEMRNAVLVLQRRYKANLLAKQEVDNYRKLKQTTVFLQQKWRAKLAMRLQKKKYDETKKATLLIQRRYRANVLAKQQSDNYQKLKKTTILIQQKWRAKLAMRLQRKKYEELRNAVLVIQRRYRANVLTKKHSNNFEKIKKTAVFIQKKWRAKTAMRLQLKNYEELKNASLVIQRRYRANKLTQNQVNNYQKLKKTTMLIQQKCRAKLAMRRQRKRYEELKNATLLIQRRYRANLMARQQFDNYQKLKKTTIFIQQKWRAKLSTRLQVKKYEELRRAVLVMQTRYRANVLCKEQQSNYQKLKKSALVIQQRWRATLAMKLQRKKHLELKQATLFIQAKHRANIAAKNQLAFYQKLKHAVIFVQRKWRANQAMKKEVANYRTIRHSAIMIQRLYRLTVERRFKAKHDKLATSLQKYARGYLIRLRFADFLSPQKVEERRELRMRQRAALRIQSTWRGYKTRCSTTPQLLIICQRLKQANENVNGSRTLGLRSEKACSQLSSGTLAVEEVIEVLKELDWITRRAPASLRKFSAKLPYILYNAIVATNRSPPDIEVCTLSFLILLNFYRFPQTREATWNPDIMPQYISVLLHFCDYENALFPTGATLLWFFLQNERCKSVIVNTDKFREKIKQVQEKCERKARMVKKIKSTRPSFFTGYSDLPTPSPVPDWGIDYKKKPRTFLNSVQAIKCIVSLL